MDDAQKKPQDDLNVQNSPSIAKEVEKPFVASESIPSIELDKEVKEAGVEVEDSPDLKPHEIIKSNVQLPTPAPLNAAKTPPPSAAPPIAKVLKRKKINTDPTQAVAWEEEIEIREDMKKVT